MDGLTVLPPARHAAPSLWRRLADIALGKMVTLLLAAGALLLGVATFTVLSGGVRIANRPNLIFGMVLSNLVVVLLLAAVLAGRLTRVWVERRRGSAGSRLHVRLVLLFSVVAVTPSILVAVFATLLFNLGIQAWFNDRVRTVLQESLGASRGYMEEHRNNIRAAALAVANDIARAGDTLSGNLDAFGQALVNETIVRGLTEAVIFDPVTRQPIVSAGLTGTVTETVAPQVATDEATRTGDAVVFGNAEDDRVQAVVELNNFQALAVLSTAPALMLQISRPVDRQILEHMTQTERAVTEYQRLDRNRSGLQITFALIFALVALLVLFAAVLTGLVLANQIARPVGKLIQAAERVRAGDLAVRVPEARSDDEVAGLSRAFNRMTGQLAAQRTELMLAYSQLDERRRFTEGVLSGVSAGVIGLDAEGRVELPNRAASELLGTDLVACVGRKLAELVPNFAPMLAEVARVPDRPRMDEVAIGSEMRRRSLLVRIGAEVSGTRTVGYVVTFDDITELQSAQRKAAWADVARRIAHEIKNPLTPIQLSAERLKRRFTKEITSDPDTFVQCADTIVRHVSDIGRMVDEFSAFARMPQPVIKPEDLGRVVREAMVLQRSARPDIRWTTAMPDRGPIVPCDRRLVGQALTNLLQNAADAVAMRPRDPGEPAGRIHVSVTTLGSSSGANPGDTVEVAVSDDGVGLPEADRDRLAEPYVTHKPKGTGLGLAIVKKILEDHGGALQLGDRADGPGAVATLSFPAHAAAAAPAVLEG